ncbi:MAG: hypothetical protein JNK15_01930, partial [Planctomycetes bacterium]|nr:hypothetical protein [Planctomycetota bacterium]
MGASFGSALRAAAIAVLPNSDIVVAGYSGQVSTNQVARWNGSAWSDLGGAMDNNVSALVAMPNGDIVAGGSFTTVGGVAMRGIARWDGAAWSGLGSGLGTLPAGGVAGVAALALLPGGDLIAAGSFSSIGGVPAINIARWNGTVWAPLGTGIGSVGLLGLNGGVLDLAVAPNGDVIATGGFTTAGGVIANNIARWNGTSWSALGSGLGFISGSRVVAMPNGDIIASGPFAIAGGVAVNWIARWDGTTWSGLGAGLNSSQTALLAMPDGSLLVGVGFIVGGFPPLDTVLRWDGSTWSALPNGPMTLVSRLARRPLGGVVAAGIFLPPTGGFAPGRLELLESSCSGSASAFGSGCVGSGGLNSLMPTTVPDVGTVFVATSAGMPALGFVLAVYGFGATTIPLSQLLSVGVQGCTLLATPDLT